MPSNFLVKYLQCVATVIIRGLQSCNRVEEHAQRLGGIQPAIHSRCFLRLLACEKQPTHQLDEHSHRVVGVSFCLMTYATDMRAGNVIRSVSPTKLETLGRSGDDIERNFFDQRSVCPSASNGPGGKADPFHRVDRGQRRSPLRKMATIEFVIVAPSSDIVAAELQPARREGCAPSRSASPD